ncbi:flavin reductase [Streptomyces sp. NPDC001728]|uniref:flavin reductase n=1 Tax=Streptomyces sp. NPDC001728 TaxID=3154396 RepID=UPI00332C5116
MAGAAEEEPLTEDAFRGVFRTHPAGVAIITAMGERQPVGFTATSLASVSSAPALLSFGVGRKVYDLPAGDHTVVIAQPIRAYQGRQARPLVYLDGHYGSVSR